jgi:RNA recognition motif-containing protein
LFVGSLPFSVTDDDLRATFAAVGEVVSAKVIVDRDSGRSKGFGFVEMAYITMDDIRSLDGLLMGGRRITVNEAKPMLERPVRPHGRSKIMM